MCIQPYHHYSNCKCIFLFQQTTHCPLYKTKHPNQAIEAFTPRLIANIPAPVHVMKVCEGISFESQTTDKICENFPCALNLSGGSLGPACPLCQQRPGLRADMEVRVRKGARGVKGNPIVLD